MPSFALTRLIISVLFFFPSIALAAGLEHAQRVDLTSHISGYLAIGLFLFAYILVILEEKIHMRKSKPVLLAAGIIWMIIAITYKDLGTPEVIEPAIRHNFLEYVELFFFLLVAMTYINAMDARGVFMALRSWLVTHNFSYQKLFWLTGLIAFFVSPVADNLTTALIMCAVILAVGQGQDKFVSISCVNIVVAANAGGAFSPFGDITTLMVWQKGVLGFASFFKLFLPAAVNFLVPALIMSRFMPKGTPEPLKGKQTHLLYGGITIVLLFLLTIVTAILFHALLHIPPVYGMMLGLGYLKLFGFYLRKKKYVHEDNEMSPPGKHNRSDFDIFEKVAKVEWDTLFFFYGVIMSVGGLAFMGYLDHISTLVYGNLGPTTANIAVGVMSAIVDNIPVMFAVLTMHPEMSDLQWLLVTLTAGVGGSLLSIGSAAGVALMGQARGVYTFMTHLKWTPVIALGYAASIAVHFMINA